MKRIKVAFLLLLVSILMLIILTACTRTKDVVNDKANENNSAPMNDAKKVALNIKGPYWVENGVRLVSGNDVIIEDPDGIYYPIVSNDGKSVIYSNGSDGLFLYSLSNSKKKKIYELKSEKALDYRVYPVGWSPDSKKVALKTSQKGGFLGGNELIIVNISDGKASVVTNKLGSADWAKDGQLIIASSSEVKIVDELGHTKKTLTTPAKRAFSNASNPAFSPDGKKVVYNCGATFYVHDIEKDSFKEVFSVKSQGKGGARINKDGKIIVEDKGNICIYDPADNSYKVYYDKAESTYPNW